MRIVLLSATALLVASTAASASDMVRVNSDGYKIEYQVIPQADGTRLITGRNLTSQEAFTFKVAGKRVTGDVAGRPVSFLVPKVRTEHATGN